MIENRPKVSTDDYRARKAMGYRQRVAERKSLGVKTNTNERKLGKQFEGMKDSKGKNKTIQNQTFCIIS